jgi:hypothetical protein
MSDRCTLPVGVKPAPQSSNAEPTATLKIPANVVLGRLFRLGINVIMKN